MFVFGVDPYTHIITWENERFAMFAKKHLFLFIPFQTEIFNEAPNKSTGSLGVLCISLNIKKQSILEKLVHMFVSDFVACRQFPFQFPISLVFILYCFLVNLNFKFVI